MATLTFSICDIIFSGSLVALRARVDERRRQTRAESGERTGNRRADQSENLGMLASSSSELAALPHFRAILDASPALEPILLPAVRIARTRLPVLVTGESGTGKELVARALHQASAAAAGPFVAVNCGALSHDLAESELFGHERGAFTGAATRKIGWFEEAAGGTLVLDEVGELPLDLQPKLLRVLESGRLRRVGGQGEVSVTVRIVALTLRDLRQDVARGRFRLDLYHRLAGFELRLPALRERPHDIPSLVEHFLAEVAPELGSHTITRAAMDRLYAYPWPGNVRELRNAIRRAAALTDGPIEASGLDIETTTSRGSIYELYHAADSAAHGTTGSLTGGTPSADDVLSLAGKTFAQMQATIFSWALRRASGSRRQAARALGISRSTFCDRVRKLGL
jgi:DNA-binding NtrC family response regulator